MNATDTPVLSALYVYMTLRCNLKCKHCYISPRYSEDRETAEDEISVGRMLRAVDRLLDNGLRSVKLSGGEPLLRADTIDLIRELKHRSLSVVMETNGMFLDPDTVATLEALQVNFVSVSLDSLNEATHEARRGVKGCYKSAIAGIENLSRSTIPSQIILTLARDNMNDVEDICYYGRRVGIGSIKINTLQCVGERAERFNKDYGLGIDEILEIYKRLLRLPPTEALIPVSILPIAFESITRIRESKHGQQCNFLNILSILPNGDLSFCGVGECEQNMILGNIHTDDIVDIWHSHPLLKHVRDVVPGKLGGVCGACIFRNKCLGFCRAEAFYRAGSWTDPHEFCQAARAEGRFPENRLIFCLK